MTQVKNIGETRLVSTPTKVLNVKLRDGAVTYGKIAPRAVSMDNLREDVQLAMQSVERGQLALAQGLGQSTVVGISQKAITDLLVSVPTVEGDYHDD